MDDAFVCTELETRKLWLRIFLIFTLFEIISCIDSLEFVSIPKSTILLGVGLGFLYKLMFYYFGYFKSGTKFLTVVLFSFAFVTGMQAASFFFDGILFFQVFNATIAKMHPIFLFLSYLLFFAFFYANVRLRQMNKLKKLNNPRV